MVEQAIQLAIGDAIVADWVPLHCHSTFSLLDGLSQPADIADRLKECGYQAGALTDHGSVSGCPAYHKALSKVGIKAILGSEFYLCEQDASLKTPENGRLSHLCVLAKNAQGWRNLMRASSASYLPEFRYRKPRLDLERLATYAGGEFLVFSGHLGSDLANACFREPRLAYAARSYEEARELAKGWDWEESVCRQIARYQRLFGKDNFWVEIQLVDHENIPAALVVARILRHCARKLGVPRVATADSHYPRKEDAFDQRTILCTAFNTTLQAVQDKLDNDEDVGLAAFFRSSNYHIPDQQEMVALHGDHPEELAAAVEIASRCESYQVGGKPLLPVFPCPGGLSPNDYLMELCRSGWTKKVEPILAKHPSKREVYQERLDREYKVITEANLASYFLIKQDVLRYATEVLKAKVGKGRGSAAGCLVSYLTSITRVNPIQHDLIFERFYSAGRNTPGRIALPDIDSDFPIAVRDQVINYLRDKYGADRVAQMATFSRMQGRGALKDVLRAHGSVSFEEMNQITEFIPDESRIADDLQEMLEETGEKSIIRWALQNNAEQLKQWAWLNEEGQVEGPLCFQFAQAIRLEGTKRSMGKHASGIVVCSEPLADICPMVWDKSAEQMLVGVDMRDAEAMGLVKLDVLGLRTLDCIMGAEEVVRKGRLAA
jgi:DNA polymerase-3 subunit alpha